MTVYRLVGMKGFVNEAFETCFEEVTWYLSEGNGDNHRSPQDSPGQDSN